MDTQELNTIPVALIGAGGKMGHRIARNLRKQGRPALHVEIGEAGRAALLAEQFEIVPLEQALDGTRIVIMCVADSAIQRVAKSMSPLLAAGTMLVALDAAVPYIGGLPDRPDLTYFIGHPCHTPMFNDEHEPAAKLDFSAGTHAKQHIVCTLMQGPESDYAVGEAICRQIFAPVMRAHRVTVDQMAVLEPVLSETVGGSCLAIIREAMDEAIARGVPREAARDFILGHLYSMSSVIFEERKGAFSAAANLAIASGKRALFRDDWKRVFEPEAIHESIQELLTK
ncbi:phosphogluconate dehydrogenase C-terminal domain-containing protein [soil metagenome]